MITIRLKRGKETKEFQYPEFKDMTIGWYVEALETVKKPELLTRYESCIDAERIAALNARKKAGAVSDASYREMLEKIIAEGEEKQKKIEEEHTLEKISLLYMQYLIDYIKFFTEMPVEFLQQLPIEGKGITIYKLYDLIEGELDRMAFDPDFSHFDYKGEKFNLPKRGMSGSTVGEFVEAVNWQHLTANLYKGEYQALPKIIALLCRKKDEELPINQEKLDEFVQERAEFFNDLPLEIAQKVGFFLRIQKQQYWTNTRTLIPEAAEKI